MKPSTLTRLRRVCAGTPADHARHGSVDEVLRCPECGQRFWQAMDARKALDERERAGR